MPFYQCEVLDQIGENKKIIYEASDEISLKAKLRNEKYILVNYKLIKEKQPNMFFAISSKVKLKEVVSFLRQFSVMIKASISIADSLNVLKKQRYSKAFQKVLMEVHQDILSGSLLSEAFYKHPKVFPRFFIDMVAIGEVSGSLEDVLKSMADYYEKDQKIKKKAKSSMVYPFILMSLIVVVLIFMAVFVIPQFKGMLDEAGGQAPLLTQIVFNCFGFIQNNILTIILAIILIDGVFYLYFRTKKGRYHRDLLLLHLPLIGRINRNLITSRFTRAFIVLLRSGMTITDCMDNLERMLGNQVFSEKFKFSIDEVKRGRRLSKSIATTNLFPMMLTEMVNVGEKSGNLEEVLESTASYFDDNVENSIQVATSMLEPIMIVLLGGIVAVVILAVYLLMISVMGSIN